MSKAQAAADGTGQTVMYEAVAASGKAALVMFVPIGFSWSPRGGSRPDEI